jgi:hypothetical protein
MAKEPRARRPKKAAPGAAGESLTVVLPAADPLAHIKHDLGGHVPGIQPSNTALPKVKSRKVAAKAKATAAAAAAKNGIDHPPWPLWEQAAPAKPKKFAWLSRLRARPLSQMSAAIVIAASCGAITGSLATVGVARFLPLDVLTSSVDTDLAQQVARIDAELVTLKAGLSTTASVDARRADTSERPDPRSAVSNDATGSIQAAALVPSPVSVVQAAIIPVVDGWVLRNVYGGSALVEGRPGLIQVMPGDSLPGVGRVETIKREDGRWVVVTTRGLIVAR